MNDEQKQGLFLHQKLRKSCELLFAIRNRKNTELNYSFKMTRKQKAAFVLSENKGKEKFSNRNSPTFAYQSHLHSHFLLVSSIQTKSKLTKILTSNISQVIRPSKMRKIKNTTSSCPKGFNTKKNRLIPWMKHLVIALV